MFLSNFSELRAVVVHRVRLCFRVLADAACLSVFLRGSQAHVKLVFSFLSFLLLLLFFNQACVYCLLVFMFWRETGGTKKKKKKK